MQLRIWIITILLAAGLAACASEATPTPQQTPETELAEPVPVTVERIEPTHTATPIPTNTPAPTSTPQLAPPTQTPSKAISAPQRTSTPLEPTPKATPFPLEFKDEIEVVLLLEDTRRIAWSPTYHELVKDSCSDSDEMIIELINLEKSSNVIITPAKIACYFLSVLWHPSGEYFFFSGEVLPQDGYELGQTYGWKMSHDAQSISDIGPISPNRGWLSEQLYVSENRVGTGVYAINIFNTETEERISGTLFDGVVKAISENFVILNEELGYSYNTSAAVLAQKSISPQNNGWLFGSDIKFFGKRLNDSGWEVSYYSRFADVLPNTDQVLVVTWEEPLLNELDSGQLISGTIPANLQFLDAQTDEVTMVLPRGIYGRFSPNGSIIAALTPDNPYPNLQLFSYPDGEIYPQWSFDGAYLSVAYRTAEDEWQTAVLSLP
jgi:hypothetical protein